MISPEDEDLLFLTDDPQEAVGTVVRLDEKRYLIAVPRVSTSSDRDYSYGVQGRYSNLWGLNHLFDVRAERGRYPDDRLREEERYVRLRYAAPYLWGDTGLFLELEHFDRIAPLVYASSIAALLLLLTRRHRWRYRRAEQLNRQRTRE
jgi:outer membrane protein assembly factor BamA